MMLMDLVGKLPAHSTKRYRQRRIDDIRWFVLHHAAGLEDQTPAAIARYHVERNGWPGIGYHYVVAADGTVYKCWPATTRTYCVAGG